MLFRSRLAIFAGSAVDIAKRTGAAIALHEADARKVEQGVEVPIVPASVWGRFMGWSMSLGLVRKMMGVDLAPFAPDIRLGDDGLALAEYGIPGRVVHTPGHTQGSVSVVLDDGRALVGCMAMNGLPSISGRPVLPIFAEDTGAIMIGWRRLFAMGVREAYPAHGEAFAAAVMRPLVGA